LIFDIVRSNLAIDRGCDIVSDIATSF